MSTLPERNEVRRSKSRTFELAKVLPGIDFEHRSLSEGQVVPGPLFKNGQVYVNDEMRDPFVFRHPSYCFLFSINQMEVPNCVIQKARPIWCRAALFQQLIIRKMYPSVTPLPRAPARSHL